jgi:carbamoyl-phosphate synthase small subunit
MVKSKKARLILENGMEFQAFSFGYPSSVAGELVFNTAMTGYPESLTDPSYRGQILLATFPLIGNYGVPRPVIENGLLSFFESDKIHISGLVISDYSFEYSHWNADQSLGKWLSDNKIPAIFGVDTRAITKVLREYGSMLGKIIIDDQEVDWFDPNTENLVDLVSTKETITYGSGKYKVMLVDCGVKYNIIRSLLRFDTSIVRVPWDYNYTNDEFDGLFISNGPGDPAICKPAIENLGHALDGEKPIFGICLGSQLLGIASGASTYKLKYGHRSHNQPVIQYETNKCYITSQNHGFAVDHHKLMGDFEPYFINLNDNTCEGIRHKTKPVFATQFHPEASGGPTDTAFLFEQFINYIQKSQ